MPMNLALDLTQNELVELRKRTNAPDDANAVARAVRKYLRIHRTRELTSAIDRIDYDEGAWHKLDQAELGQPEVKIDP